MIHRMYTIKKAVDDISFSIEKGELVGYIGPNGADKSTTIKMLSGILTPTSGRITVGGIIPYENRRDNNLRMGVVFGQRSQLYWDLPMGETFGLYKRMYRIGDEAFRRNVDFYVELLEMQVFLQTPVRQLSLGQKMRGNIAVALLHDLEIVYLDEPTIGLDVVAKDCIRRFLREVNREKNTTLILTTHDMDDIGAVCDRLIMIDAGKKLYDGSKDYIQSIAVIEEGFPHGKKHLYIKGIAHNYHAYSLNFFLSGILTTLIYLLTVQRFCMYLFYLIT